MTEPCCIRNLSHSDIISFPNYKNYRTIIHPSPKITICIHFLNYPNERTFIHSKPKAKQYKLGPKQPNGENLHIYEYQTASIQLVTQITLITKLLSIINPKNPDANQNNSKVMQDAHPRPRQHQFNFPRTLCIARTFMPHVSKPPLVNLCLKLHEGPNLLPSKI